MTTPSIAPNSVPTPSNAPNSTTTAPSIAPNSMPTTVSPTTAPVPGTPVETPVETPTSTNGSESIPRPPFIQQYSDNIERDQQSGLINGGDDEMSEFELASSGYETISLPGLSFDLYGIDEVMVSSMGLVEDAIKVYFVAFFQAYRSTLEYDVMVSLMPTPSRKNRNLRRELSPGETATVTFDIAIKIKSRAETSSTDIEDSALATLPLASEEGRSAFVNLLKESGNASFESLTGMSEIRLP